MSRIDPSRISEIIKAVRALSVRGAPEKVKPAEARLEAAEAASVVGKNRDLLELKARIAEQISIARTRSADISDERISLVAIQEIMHWEFGDDILDHPEFKNISQAIVSRIHQSPQTAQQFMGVLNNL